MWLHSNGNAERDLDTSANVMEEEKRDEVRRYLNYRHCLAYDLDADLNRPFVPSASGPSRPS